MRKHTYLMLAALTMALGACASLAKQAFAPPTVDVKGVRVRNIGLQGGTLEVTLSLANPNEYRIDTRRVTYNFFVDSTQVVTGAVDRLMTLENRGTAELVLPITFGYREMGIAMQQFINTGALNYRVTGEFTLATPFGDITRPYSGTGRVDGMPGR